MNNFLTKIQDQYPWSNLNKYWDHYELFLKELSSEWWYKICWTMDQVKENTELIINFLGKWVKE